MNCFLRIWEFYLSGIIEVIVYVFLIVICFWLKVLGLSWFMGIIDLFMKEFLVFDFDFCVGIGENKSLLSRLFMLFFFGSDVMGFIFCLFV